MTSTTTKRGLPWLWIFVGALVVFVSVPLVFAYFGMRSRLRDRSLLQEEIERIAAEPLTTSEMDAYAATIPADPRATQAWLDALAGFETEDFKKAREGVPSVNEGALPGVDLPLTAQQSAPIAQYLDDTRSLHDALYAAAALPGEVRFPRDYRRGIAVFKDELNSLRTASYSLQLEFQILARDADLKPALHNLQTRFKMARIAEHETNTDGFLVRIAIIGSTLRDLRALANARALDQTQLESLQAMFAPIDIHAQAEKVLLGERAMAFHAFQYQESPDTYDLAKTPFDTTRDLSRIHSPRDCAKTMQIMRELRAAAMLPLPQAIDATRQVDALEDPAEQKQFPMTALLVPTLDALIEADARTVAEVRLTQTSLAIRRYQLKNGSTPANLADLVPDYLPAVLQDPFDNQPLRYQRDADGVALYSVNRNRRDDGGQAGEADVLGPDFVVRMTFPAPTSVAKD